MSCEDIGASLRRREDPRLRTGRGRDVDDLAVRGALLRSPRAHPAAAASRRRDLGFVRAGRAGTFIAGAWALCTAMIWAAGVTESMGADRIERPSTWAKAIPGVPGLPNLYEVTPTLYRSAQPSKEGLRYLGERRPLEPGAQPVKTVLSLRAFNDDARIVPAPPSLRYERIRFKTWHPEAEDIVKFLRIATTPALQPVLVHCQYGSDRTGTMVALYRIVVQGWSKEGALLEMTQGGYGFHPLWQNLVHYVMALDIQSIGTEVAKQGPWPQGQ